jgi:hypothetical protein
LFPLLGGVLAWVAGCRSEASARRIALVAAALQCVLLLALTLTAYALAVTIGRGNFVDHNATRKVIHVELHINPRRVELLGPVLGAKEEP